ncbi:MAG: hypothetical protein JWR34_5188 [Mycobacterium sp.]|nr:hypothetical protein [Mycobacterium sp.]
MPGGDGMRRPDHPAARDLSGDVRRDRCLSEEMEQLEQQRRFLSIGEEDETGNPTRYPPQLLKMNAEHRRKFNKMVADAKTAYTFAKTPSFTKMIRDSAQWVDAHVPAHDTGEIADHGLEHPARSLYSYVSSFIHGYKWMTDYGRNGAEFTMIAMPSPSHLTWSSVRRACSRPLPGRRVGRDLRGHTFRSGSSRRSRRGPRICSARGARPLCGSVLGLALGGAEECSRAVPTLVG